LVEAVDSASGWLEREHGRHVLHHENGAFCRPHEVGGVGGGGGGGSSAGNTATYD
jgi:hypothetical protein